MSKKKEKWVTPTFHSPLEWACSDSNSLDYEDGWNNAVKEFADRLIEKATENVEEERYSLWCVVDDAQIEDIEKELYK